MSTLHPSFLTNLPGNLTWHFQNVLGKNTKKSSYYKKLQHTPVQNESPSASTEKLVIIFRARATYVIEYKAM